jgi:hypothetical protein
MNRSDTEHKSANGTVAASTANSHLSGSRLTIARVLWLTIVVPSLGLFVFSLPVYYQQIQRACVDPVTCNIAGALTAQGLQALSTLGFSASAYAALLTIFFVIIAAIWCGVGFLILWRRSDDWLALLAALVLVIFGITASANTAPALALAYPLLALPLALVSFLGFVSFGTFFLLFPNGRLVPRWMGLILLLYIINAFLNAFPSLTSPFNANWPVWLYVLVTFVLYGAIIYSQIFRYRYVSTPVQRQQTKWIVLGVTLAAASYIGLLVIGTIIPSLDNTILYNEVWTLIFPIALLLIPLSIGFSILSYRLYDIDVLINRTLVYGSLTVLLALVYVGLIFALQYLLRGIINQNNDVAIVVSTLAIAALFQPLRHRLQKIVDRRFYRSKYDAAKIIEAFSATLRNEVDLSQLSEHLIAVVQETMQPAHVSLWVLQSSRTDTSSLQISKPLPEAAGVDEEIAEHDA